MKFSNMMPEHLKSWKYVFNSQNIFPANFTECRRTANSVGYGFFAFNGCVYTTSALDPSLDALCPVEELKGE